MKKKLALLLAAVLTLFTLSTPGLSASSVNSANSVGQIPEKSLVVQGGAVQTGDVSDSGDLDVEYVLGGSYLSIEMGDNWDTDILPAGVSIMLTLSGNAEWFFAKGEGIRAITGADTTYVDGMADNTGSLCFISDATAIDSGDNYNAYGNLEAYWWGEPYYNIRVDKADRSIAILTMRKTLQCEETLVVPMVLRTNDDGGDITVTPNGGNLTSNAVRISREAALSGTYTTIASVQTGSDLIPLDRITIRETTRNILRNGGYTVLTIDEGYEWVVPETASMTAGSGLTHVDDFDKTAPNYYFNREKNELYIQFSDLEPASRTAYGAIYLEGLAVKPNGETKAAAFEGTISMTIEPARGVMWVYPPDSNETDDVVVDMTGSGVRRQTGILIGRYEDTTSVRASILSVRSGSNSIPLDIITLQETAPNRLQSGGYLQFALPEGYEFKTTPNIFAGGGFLKAEPLVLGENAFLNPDGNILTLKINITKFNQELYGALYFEGLVIAPNVVAAAAKDAETVITLTVKDAEDYNPAAPKFGVKTQKLTVGRFTGGVDTPGIDTPEAAPRFTDEESNPLTALTAPALVTELTKTNLSDEPESLTMYVAGYAPDGKVIHIGKDSKVIGAGESAVFSVTLDMPENADGAYAGQGYYAKVFLWDSETFVPVTAAYVLA